MSRILFVMTGADRLTLTDGSAHPTGYWAEEFLAPYRTLSAAGHDVVVATPGGVAPTMDAASAGDGTAAELAAVPALRAPLRLADVDPAEYAAVFYPGGHGPMADLATDPASAAVLRGVHRAGRPVALVCHGVAALLAVDGDGGWPFAGYRMTAFTDAEEKAAGLADRLPWLVQSRLEELGADFVAGPDWASHVVVDRNLYTGQNPASSGALADRLVTALDC